MAKRSRVKRLEMNGPGIKQGLMEDPAVLVWLESEAEKLKDDLEAGVGRLPGFEHAEFDVVKGQKDTSKKSRPWRLVRVRLYGEKTVGQDLSWGHFMKYSPSKLKTKLYSQLKNGGGYFKMRKNASAWKTTREKKDEE